MNGEVTSEKTLRVKIAEKTEATEAVSQKIQRAVQQEGRKLLYELSIYELSI